jgi:ATP-dependent Lhr-like helicase
MASDVLSQFLPPVAEWFRKTLGTPTPAQLQGWPAIAAGKNTLILAPTGSGKTLAAFLACLDALWRQPSPARQVQVLYISPLKALNNDIHRNLQIPLAGVVETARAMGYPLPEITAAVRTGDTPATERQRLIKRPPHVLITTPESLHLLLTSQGRESLRGVQWCIVDEIHALCSNKRGVFLSLLLERLEALNPRGFVRIGLSATQRPLDEVARFLGGPRPVTIIDAGLRKDLDLRIISPVDTFGPMPEKSIWPSIYRLLFEEIKSHRSTIIFANGRRSAERLTTALNDFAEADSPLPIARAHHGSISLEVRQQIEQALKEGRLPCVVATASLELGIDMGAVDLVVQVESCGNVARGLQRVGRAGHLVGQKSKGRLIPKTLPDLLEEAVLAREMLAGRVEATHVPTNCLDVLAQQVVAMVAVESWDVPALFDLVRRAYPYRDLTAAAFESVLEMVSGRFPAEAFRELRPRISWDRVHNRLHALPGSKQVALVNGGTIPDTGQYAAYIDGQEVRIGELDEEFVYERRVGDVFVLGTTAWRIEQIENDRVFVSRAEGLPAIMPFWRGEYVRRSRDLGLALGAFLREFAARLPQTDCLDWLQHECHLDQAAARNLRDFVRRQIERAECLPTDQTLLVEAFRDQVGDWHIAILSPFGSRFNLALRLALEARLRQRFGYQPQALHHDEGLLLRLVDVDEPPLDLLDNWSPEDVEKVILAELSNSALFAIRFRQNAARALLMPRAQPGHRAPLWLQRLKARNLLQIARQFPNFPVVVETYRECLQDHLDVPRLQQMLADIGTGTVKVVRRRAETPSPFAAGLLFNFTAAFMYDYDRVQPSPNGDTKLDRQLLEELIAPDQPLHLLDPRAVSLVEQRLRGFGRPPRTVEEMADWLRRLGDLAPSELEGPMASFLERLETDGRVSRVVLRGVNEPDRWILTEERELYTDAFDRGKTEAAATIFGRYLQTHALVGLADILARYPFEESWAERQLEEWTKAGQLVSLTPASADQPLQWSAPANLEQVQRGTLAILRREILTCPAHQFADFLLRWQHRHPDTRLEGIEGLRTVLERLQGLPLPVELWEQNVLPSRIRDYQARWLDDGSLTSEWIWTCRNETGEGNGMAGFLTREKLQYWPRPTTDPSGDEETGRVYEQLRQKGAAFGVDLAQALGLSPAHVRRALWKLAQSGLATNDRFDVLRKGEEAEPRDAAALTRRMTLHNMRRRSRQPPEGRWSLIAWGSPDTETRALHHAYLLLERYGVVARELALLDPWLLPWRVLYEIYSRLELAGDVRRGYFVEGLSGAQFALPEAVTQLSQAPTASRAGAPVLLLPALDPANLYGSNAPLGWNFTGSDAANEGGFARRPGNWLAIRGGHPILVIENHGKRLVPLANANRDDLVQAITRLGDLLHTAHGVKLRGKLSVEEWNGQNIMETEGKELLEAAGFVRDFPAMSLYGAWR